MTTEDYFEEWLKTQKKMFVNPIDFAEYYHKAKIEAISDEEIHEAGFQFYETIEDKRIWERGTIWFKNQLLKQQNNEKIYNNNNNGFNIWIIKFPNI